MGKGNFSDDFKRDAVALIRERRSEDAWREASWDEALDRIAARSDAVGRAATATWAGHGNSANGYGFRMAHELMTRFAATTGTQNWSPAMICRILS